MTRHAAMLAIPFVAAVAVLVWWVVADRTPGVTWSNARRIDRYMSLAEIEAILGPGTPNMAKRDGEAEWQPTGSYTWDGADLRIIVDFDDELVAMKIDRGRPPPSYLDRLSEWLGF